MKKRDIGGKIFGKTIQEARAAMAVLALFVLLAGGCGNALLNLPGGDEQPTDPVEVQEVDTGLRITVPLFSPWLLEYLAGSGETGTEAAVASRSLGDGASRAWMTADSVVLTVLDSLDQAVITETVSHDDSIFSGADPGFTLTLPVPVGTDYTLEVEIYNDAESASVPVVSGSSASFSITEGAITEVTVICEPENPVALTLGAAAESYTQTSTVYDEGSDSYVMGGETWFSFTSPSNGAVMFTMDIPDGLGGGVFIFPSPGLADPAGSVRIQGCTEDGSVFFADLLPDSLYYAAFVLEGDGSAQSFSLHAEQANTISGTVTLAGVTDTGSLPAYEAIFLVSTFQADMSISDFLVDVSLGEPVVNGGNLEWSYVLGYDGDEDAVLAAGYANNMSSWPAEGDFVGAYDGNTGTPMDFIAGTGIEPYHFSGDMTGIDFNLQLIEEDTAPTLEETRVDVTVNFEYTGSEGPADTQGAVILTYSDGGPAFAGQSFYYNDFTTDFEGSITFDDPLVPVGEQVYAQIYFDADMSFSLSAGDPYYKHTTPISVDGGTATLILNDTATCSASCPDAAGSWLTSSLWGEMVVTLTEDTFSIIKRTDSGSPTYWDVADYNNYGIITNVNNSEGYAIGQWTYHPAGAVYEGTYMKLVWDTSGDFVVPTDLYWAFDTEAEAIAASTGSTEITSASLLW